jgi:hypothetical protein
MRTGSSQFPMAAQQMLFTVAGILRGCVVCPEDQLTVFPLGTVPAPLQAATIRLVFLDQESALTTCKNKDFAQNGSKNCSGVAGVATVAAQAQIPIEILLLRKEHGYFRQLGLAQFRVQPAQTDSRSAPQSVRSAQISLRSPQIRGSAQAIPNVFNVSGDRVAWIRCICRQLLAGNQRS